MHIKPFAGSKHSGPSFGISSIKIVVGVLGSIFRRSVIETAISPKNETSAGMRGTFLRLRASGPNP